MSVKDNIVDYVELLECAMTLGYSWNKAIDILRADGVPPEPVLGEVSYTLEDIKANKFNWTVSSCNIVLKTMAEKHLDRITIIQWRFA